MRFGNRWLIAVVALAGALAGPGASAVRAGVQGTVTSLEGEAVVGSERARLNKPIAEGEAIVTEEGASCSVLLDRSSLIQFCGQGAVRVRTDAARNATILEVEKGTTRALVEKREPGSPLEIHTPLAIAEIRGTVVSVTVDPATGDSTFALEEGEVRIAPRDPAKGPAVTLRAGQQITFRAAGGPPMAEALQLQEMATRANCLDDVFHRDASARIASADREIASTTEILESDLEAFVLPPVGSGGGGPPTIPPSMVQNPPAPRTVCGVGSVCGEVEVNPGRLPPPLPPPPLPPGEQNSF